MLVPKGNALPTGKLVHAEVEHIYPPGTDGRAGPAIKLKARKQPVACDYLCVVTGTNYSFPGKVPWWIGSGACTRLYEKIRDSIAKATSITIVGGGPVGCELAGAVASGFPGKPLRLIHKGPHLCSSVRGPDLSASQGSQITKTSGAEGNGKYLKQKSMDLIKTQLESIGCEVVLNEQVVLDEDALGHSATNRVNNVVMKSVEKATAKTNAEAGTEGKSNEVGGDADDLTAGNVAPTVDPTQFVSARGAAVKPKPASFMADAAASGTTEIKTATGKTFPADLVFFCTGPIANSEVYETYFKQDYRGRVCCDDQMRCIPKTGEPCDQVFGLGDCCGTRYDDEQNYTAGEAQCAVLVKNIIAAAQGKPQKMKDYKPNKHPALMLYMGRKAGVSELFGMRFGKWLSHSMKSPEKIADMVYGMMKAGKPPKSEWQMKKKQGGGCCRKGTKTAKVTYAPGSDPSGDDDW